MLEQDLVSIITPSYNTQNYIIATIQSVQRQTYQNWEMILVDDCSSDQTISIVENYIRETGEARIRLYVNQSNCGAACSRNAALGKAKGRWIAFLDSDDLWSADKLFKQVDFMKKNHYGFTYTKYSEIDEASEPLHRIVSGPPHITKRGMYRYCWPGCLTVMYDAEAVGMVQIADLKKNNDYAMWLKVIKKTDCYLLDETLAQYRKRTGSISNQSFRKLIKWHYLVFRISEQKGVIASTAGMLGNIVFGFYKKMKYVYTGEKRI